MGLRERAGCTISLVLQEKKASPILTFAHKSGVRWDLSTELKPAGKLIGIGREKARKTGSSGRKMQQPGKVETRKG